MSGKREEKELFGQVDFSEFWLCHFNISAVYFIEFSNFAFSCVFDYPKIMRISRIDFLSAAFLRDRIGRKMCCAYKFNAKQKRKARGKRNTGTRQPTSTIEGKRAGQVILFSSLTCRSGIFCFGSPCDCVSSTFSFFSVCSSVSLSCFYSLNIGARWNIFFVFFWKQNFFYRKTAYVCQNYVLM